MYNYSMMQWLFFFYFYCFFGWCFESAYVSLKKRRFVNRGFMRGPFLPLYGSGAIMMLVVSMPFQDNLILTYIAGFIGATALEYVTGVVMEALFKVRYWDYSNQKFNFQGQICLGSSLAWGGLTILMTEVIHKPVARLAEFIPPAVLTLIVWILTCYIAGDFALSFRAALDLRDVLVKMEKAKEELAHLQKRLDVVIAVAESEIEERRQAREQRVDEIRAEMEEHLRILKALKERNTHRISLLRGNPGMVSKKFKETLEELKAAALEHLDKDKK